MPEDGNQEEAELGQHRGDPEREVPLQERRARLVIGDAPPC